MNEPFGSSSPARATHSSGVRIWYTPSARNSSTVVAPDFTWERMSSVCHEWYVDRVVEQVLADAGPQPVGILGHEDRPRPFGLAYPPGLDTQPLALVPVELHQLVVAHRRKEAEPEPGGPPGRGRTRPAHHDHGMGLLRRVGA